MNFLFKKKCISKIVRWINVLKLNQSIKLKIKRRAKKNDFLDYLIKYHIHKHGFKREKKRRKRFANNKLDYIRHLLLPLWLCVLLKSWQRFVYFFCRCLLKYTRMQANIEKINWWAIRVGILLHKKDMFFQSCSTFELKLLCKLINSNLFLCMNSITILTSKYLPIVWLTFILLFINQICLLLCVNRKILKKVSYFGISLKLRQFF